ncbi:hypothetical protein NDU88_004185 [Pleurodeles waltl]|uniref:Uncharacterized protein n=1 Tax=Pleurodeles waltl TaxID=8319 RepID=A0AAV7T762_PLEWA|nr:hypothetical protein NDU88_004185 [Pleurodeles waltl]
METRVLVKSTKSAKDQKQLATSQELKDPMSKDTSLANSSGEQRLTWVQVDMLPSASPMIQEISDSSRLMILEQLSEQLVAGFAPCLKIIKNCKRNVEPYNIKP